MPKKILCIICKVTNTELEKKIDIIKRIKIKIRRIEN